MFNYKNVVKTQTPPLSNRSDIDNEPFPTVYYYIGYLLIFYMTGQFKNGIIYGKLFHGPPRYGSRTPTLRTTEETLSAFTCTRRS